MRTADLLSQSDELPNGHVGASDAADDRPLALVVDRSRDHVGEILHCGEGEAVVVSAVRHQGSAFVEVDWQLHCVDVLRRFVWACQVVQEEARLEECVFENLSASSRVRSSQCLKEPPLQLALWF